MNSELIAKIIELIVLIIIGVIGTNVIPFIKAKIGVEKYALIMDWARTFVSAAEKIVSGDKKGEEKRDMVIEWIRQKSWDIGLTLTEEQIRAILESALAEVKAEQII